MSQQNHPGLGRRGFLVSLGATIGGLAIPLSGKGAVTTRRSHIRVGVLMPAQQTAVADAFMGGLRVAFDRPDDDGVRIELLPEYAKPGNGTREKIARMAQSSGISAMIALVGANAMAPVQDALRSSNLPLFACDLGARPFLHGQAGPGTWQVTAGLWESCLAAGRWGVKTYGPRAALVTNLYDAGYDTAFAFRHAVESVGGSVSVHVIDIPPLDGNIEQAVQEVAATKPNFVFTLIGQGGQTFLNAWNTSGHGRTAPLVASAMTVDDDVLPYLGGSLVGTPSFAGWSRLLATAQNQAFVKAFRATERRDPGPFAALGYDAAAVFGAVAHATGGDLSAHSVDAVMPKLQVASTRGILTFDPATRVTRSPLFLRTVAGSIGNLANQVVETWPALDSATTEPITAPREFVTGWTNTYMC